MGILGIDILDGAVFIMGLAMVIVMVVAWICTDGGDEMDDQEFRNRIRRKYSHYTVGMLTAEIEEKQDLLDELEITVDELHIMREERSGG